MILVEVYFKNEPSFCISVPHDRSSVFLAMTILERSELVTKYCVYGYSPDNFGFSCTGFRKWIPARVEYIRSDIT